MTMTPERARELIGHTPGPWQSNGSHIYSADHIRELICQCVGFSVVEDLALIAAAPDLLAGYLALVEENERLRAALASTPVDNSGGGIG